MSTTPKALKCDFRTYEAQIRLITALLAAHPGIKLDYKAISKYHAYYGQNWTASGIEHFFRPIKKEAVVIRAAVDNGDVQRPSTSTPKRKRDDASTGGPTPSRTKTSTAKKMKKAIETINLDGDESDGVNEHETPVKQRKAAANKDIAVRQPALNYSPTPVSSMKAPQLDHFQDKTPSEEEQAVTPAYTAAPLLFTQNDSFSLSPTFPFSQPTKASEGPSDFWTFRTPQGEHGSPAYSFTETKKEYLDGHFDEDGEV